MGLRAQAETDLGAILEDSAYGFGWPVTVTNPDSSSVSLIGFSNDISQVIDPDTGVIVSGRAATISLRISSLTSAGLGLPVGIADSSEKPWLVSFDDINGNSFTFKVMQTNPDRALGVVVCHLELYEV